MQAPLVRGWTSLGSYQLALVSYGLAGAFLAGAFLGLSLAVEAAPSQVTSPRCLGLHRSRSVVMRLSALFALDAFAGRLKVQSKPGGLLPLTVRQGEAH